MKYSIKIYFLSFCLISFLTIHSHASYVQDRLQDSDGNTTIELSETADTFIFQSGGTDVTTTNLAGHTVIVTSATPYIEVSGGTATEFSGLQVPQVDAANIFAVDDDNDNDLIVNVDANNGAISLDALQGSPQTDQTVFTVNVDDGTPAGAFEFERFTSNVTDLIFIDGNGFVTGNYINADNGATLDSGGTWNDGSSRSLKFDILPLDSIGAKSALMKLEPVTFKYKRMPEEERVGFIAEDVPELVAMNERKTLNSMEIVALLTQVVQDQQKEIADLKTRIQALERS